MKRLSFTATIATYDVVHGAHVVALAPSDGSPGYVMLQRSGEGDADDDGIHLEFFHEAASGYNLISNCRVSRNAVHLDLVEPFAGAAGLDVALQIADDKYDNVVRGIKHVFHGKLQQLSVASPA
jgi:hypothetical protein